MRKDNRISNRPLWCLYFFILPSLLQIIITMRIIKEYLFKGKTAWKSILRETSPGGPAIKTQHFYFRGHVSIPD